MRALLLTLLLAFAANPSIAGIHYVDIDALGADTGVSWDDAFTDLRDALAIAISGDEIWIAEGEYGHSITKDVRAVFEVPSGVSVYGGFIGTEASIEERVLDEGATVLTGAIVDRLDTLGIGPRVIAIADARDEVVLDGLKILGAAVPEVGLNARAGGLLAERSVLRMRNVEFRECGALRYEPLVQLGGGAALIDCSADLAGVTFYHCNASEGGGSIGCLRTELQVDSSYFRGFGGAKSELPRVSLVWNFGGVYGDDASLLKIQNSMFVQCVGLGSGALRGVVDLDNVVVSEGYADIFGAPGLVGTGTLDNVLFTRNISDGGPGAVEGGGVFRNVSFDGNEVYNSSRAALLATEATRLENCTFVGNSGSLTDVGGAIFSGDFTAEICNTIFWGNWSRTPDNIVDSYQIDGATVSVSNSIVQGSGGSGAPWDASLGIDLGGNLDVDPRFVDIGNLDVRLALGSPAIDTGRSDCVSDPALDVDLDGNPRFAGAEVDMGAYEFQGPFCEPFEVVFGDSWDGTSLQEILDAEYGVGVIDVATDYEGARCGDAETPYWLDDSVDGWIVREVADFAPTNVLGWYAESLNGPPTIDGVDDGVIFGGSAGEGETAFVGLTGPTRFGLYLNPNGAGDGTNAPEPEIFFTNRFYNDEGVDGSGAVHGPTGGDPQALIFNITHLRNGVPTYVVAWEDIDAGSPLAPAYQAGFTDNDFNDLVVEIRANSPVSIDEDFDRGDEAQLVTGLSLRVAPNPFNPSTSVMFAVPAREHARVAVYDVRGREIGVLFQGVGTGEVRALMWSPNAIGSGVYFVRLETEGRVVTEKVTVLK